MLHAGGIGGAIGQQFKGVLAGAVEILRAMLVMNRERLGALPAAATPRIAAATPVRSTPRRLRADADLRRADPRQPPQRLGVHFRLAADAPAQTRSSSASDASAFSYAPARS